MGLSVSLFAGILGARGLKSCNTTKISPLVIATDASPGRQMSQVCDHALAECDKVEGYPLHVTYVPGWNRTEVVCRSEEDGGGECDRSGAVESTAIAVPLWVVGVTIFVPLLISTSMFVLANFIMPEPLEVRGSGALGCCLQYIVSREAFHADGTPLSLVSFLLSSHLILSGLLTLSCGCCLCCLSKKSSLGVVVRQAVGNASLALYTVVVITFAANVVYFFFQQPVKKITCDDNEPEIQVGESGEVVDVGSAGPLDALLQFVGLSVSAFLGVGILISLVSSLIVMPARTAVTRRIQGGARRAITTERRSWGVCFAETITSPLAVIIISVIFVISVTVGAQLRRESSDDVNRLLLFSVTLITASLIVSAIELAISHCLSTCVVSAGCVKVKPAAPKEDTQAVNPSYEMA